jgi:hypothetical protein
MGVEVNVERKAVEVKWDAEAGGAGDDGVTVYAQGKDGEWHNTAQMPNDGLAALSYPADFTGESYVEVRDANGEVLDSGTIEVK